MSEISKKAERIAARYNKYIDAGSAALDGGVLAFNHLGYGGQWYSADNRPPAAIIVPFRAHHGRMGTRQAQDLIDALEGSTR